MWIFHYLCAKHCSKMNAMKRRIFRGFIVLMAGVILSGCCGLSKMKDIKVTSCALESYSLNGLRSIDAVLAVGIDNPTFAFKVMDLNGVVKYNGEEFATYSADTLSVDKKCSKIYDLSCSATLSGGVGLMKLMQIVKNGSLDGFTTDVTATVKLKSGAGTTFKLKDVDLNKMTE